MIQSTPSWQELVGPYQRPSARKSGWQLVNSLGPFVVCWTLAYRFVDVSTPLYLACCLLASGFLVRLYIIQHDCGHGSFLPSARGNDLLGACLGAITLIPYYRWRHDHAVHHAVSGNLVRRGRGDIWTMTVREYRDATPSQRFKYRIYRNAFVLFGIGPLLLFVVLQRLPHRTDGPRETWSVHFTNLALIVALCVMGHTLGFRRVLTVQMPITWASSTVAVWLFYIQHQFADTYWEGPPRWDYTAHALSGASWYKLPTVLRWFSGNIGIHHVHHLSPKIPNYELQRCMDSHPFFQNPRAVTFWGGFRCASLKLWDEDQRRLVSWREFADEPQQNALSAMYRNIDVSASE